MPQRAFPLLPLFPLLFLLACGETPSESAESTESDYTVTPTGGTGQIKVTVPAAASATKVIVRRQEGGSSLELTSGVAKAVAPGKYCLYTRVTGTNPYDVQFETQSDCSLVVAAGATVDYALGAVQFERSRDELLLGLDVGRDSLYANESVRRMMRTTAPVAHARGTFEYTYVSIKDGAWSSAQWKTLDSISFSVTGGATAMVDLVDTTDRWGVRIVPATGRALPNTTSRIDARVQWSDYAVLDAWFDLGSLAKPLLVRAKALSNVRVNTPAVQTFALTQPVSDKKLARLDVEHAQITMADGSTKTASGTVTIGAFTFPTGTGVDLLPGTYDIAIAYAHPADNSPVTTNVTADLQP